MTRIPSALTSSEDSTTYNSFGKRNSTALQLSTENSLLLPETENKSNFTQCLRKFFSSTAFAIITFVALFSVGISSVSSPALILDKVCLVHLRYPSDVCSNLNNYTDFKSVAEKMAANYSLAHRLLKIVPSVLISFAAGPWSDKYGRKLLLQIAIFGYVVDALGACLCSYFQYARVEYYLMATAIMGMTGGHLSVVTFLYTYITDSTTIQKRTMQYAVLEVLFGIAQPSSVALGGLIYNLYGYTIVFLISACGFSFNLIWIPLFLSETRGLDNKDSWKVKIRSFFSCARLIDSLTASVKRRENNLRKVVWLLIISNCITYFATYGTTDINFLYVHHQFNWGNPEYSSIFALYLTCGIISLLLVLPLFKRFQVRDPVIGVIGSISVFGKFLGIGLAKKTIIFHAANIFGLLAGCATISLRSNFSKVIPKDELGKLFSFVVMTESIFQIFSTVVITQLFNVFLDTFPGMPYVFIAILLILPFATFIWILCHQVPDHKDVTKEMPKDTNDNIDVT